MDRDGYSEEEALDQIREAKNQERFRLIEINDWRDIYDSNIW